MTTVDADDWPARLAEQTAEWQRRRDTAAADRAQRAERRRAGKAAGNAARLQRAIERADARLAQATADGTEDSWHEDP